MLTQFKNLYPRGSLISELIEIDRDLYIVKASVIVDGVILATAMAGCQTIESAEDLAKQRALELLNLKIPTKKIAESKTTNHLSRSTRSSNNLSSKNCLIKSESWHNLLAAEFKKDYFIKLLKFVESERQQYQVFPPQEAVFTALEITPIEKIKAVIIGQDPYHNTGQAHGLSFSVQKGVAIPASLKNIFQELARDLNITPPTHGNLTAWARQGVLLLNTVLTVRAHQANSHKNKGWETFTDAVINKVNLKLESVIFVLWGGYAKKKLKLIDTNRHTIIQSAHPSPLSARNGFFGSKPFSKINSVLREAGKPEIDWQLSMNHD